MNHTQLPLALEVLAEAEITAHIIGEAGIGKSQGIYQFGDKIGAEVVEVRVGLMADAGDLVGIQEFVRHQKTGEALSTRHVLPDWFMKAVVQIEEAASKQKRVILFFDELTRGHKDLLQACFELVYDRALKGTKVRPDTIIIAASNPTTDDYAGSMEFSDDAFSDRFCHIKLEPTVEEWMNFSKSTGVDRAIIDFIGEYPQMLDKEHKPWSLDFVNPSRRSWVRLNKLLEIIDRKGGAYKELELELMFGIVGEKAALAFQNFRNTYIKSIKANDVLEAYTTQITVKESVLKAIEKDRKDMLAQLSEELVALLGKHKSGLTQLQADNIAALVTDLPIETAYALIQKLTGSGEHSDAVKLVDGKTPGLWAHPGLVNRMDYIKQQRMAVKKQAKAAAEKAKKGVDKEEIPF